MTVLSPLQLETRARHLRSRQTVKSGTEGNQYLPFLKVERWQSEYPGVNLLLRHLSRKCGSEASRRAYLTRLHSFCIYEKKDKTPIFEKLNPDELVKLPRRVIESRVQAYVDQFNDGKHSVRYLNNIINLLRTFFAVNGFKGVNALEIEGYHMPARYRKVPEYIPKKNEVYAMADSACSLRDRALILTGYSTGLRNSTLRALLIRDVEDELSRGFSNILVPVYPEMKLVDPCGCKGNIRYTTFTCDEATDAIRLYLRERKEKYGEVLEHEPLFASDYNQIDRYERKSKLLSARQVQHIVKMAAFRAGLCQWRHVKPHCLRKSFETVLHSELIDGGHLDPKVQEYFEGHILPGSQDAYFDKTDVEMLRTEYAKLNFGRVAVENKFKVLRMAVARAFEGTGLNGDEVMREYVQMRLLEESSETKS